MDSMDNMTDDTPETGPITDHVVWYVVSCDSDQITMADDAENLDQYACVEDAESDIRNGQHGQYGTRYILAVDLSVVAVVERSWTLVHKTD